MTHPSVSLIKIITCSRTLQALLVSPISFKSRSYVCNAVSCVFPLFEAVKVDPPPARNASPPRIAKLSRAFSRDLSRASPRRSIIPPVGRKATNACRRVYESMEEEPADEVEAEADAGGAAERV
jgi:hypothetical protein